MIARLVLAGIMAAGLLSAQRGGKGGGGGGDYVPTAQQTPSRLDMIDNIIKLNKDQKKSVKTLMDDGQKEAAPLRDQILKGSQDLGQAVLDGKSQDEIDKAVSANAALQAQMTGIEMRVFAKLYQSLDKEQQPKAAPVFYMMPGIFMTKNWNEVK